MATQAGSDDVRIEIDALANELTNLMSHNLSVSRRCCIFKVPKVLSRHKKEAYEPNAFSIGPYHSNNEHLKATEKIKLNYLQGLISRLPGTNSEKKVKYLLAAISEIGERARECYEGDIGMNMNEFVKVLVLDGCFLIELFRKFSYKYLRREGDPIYGVKSMFTCLSHDLILLENQIPWLVLDRLSYMTVTRDMVLPLNKLVANFFRQIFSKGVAIFQDEIEYSNNKHILDLLRNSMIGPSSLAKEEKSRNWQVMKSATSLQDAGIKFKKATSTTASSILDIKFEDGVLEIPSLLIQDNSESLYRNLICFEQCLPNCEEVFTSYFILLDNLINTSKDMEILCKNEIIDNLLDIGDATVLFNRIVNDTNCGYFYYGKLVFEVNKYCRRRWPRHRTVLVHDYFRNPWAIISVIAATLLLILTFLQTLFTIIK